MADDNSGLFSKLQQLDSRFTEIEKQLVDPEVACNVDLSIKLSKEQGKLRPLVEKYREYAKAQEGLDDANFMLEDPDVDPDFAELAKAEVQELTAKIAKVVEDIKETLVMSDDASIGSIIIEIRPGTGGDEAGLFARDLATMYSRYAEKKHWKVEMLTFSTTEMGGLRECVMNIKGNGVWSDLGYEGGGHRVQRVPETETQGRVHTSAATVAVLPEPEDVDVKIEPADVLEHVSRAGGPGGQSVNKTNSAIKLEHVPTGITVSMRDEKSQHKNRAKAWRILRTRIFEYETKKINAERESVRKTMIGSGDRSSRIRTYNFPQNRVTDHRIGLSLYSLDKVIMGELDEIVSALKVHDKQERLENL